MTASDAVSQPTIEIRPIKQKDAMRRTSVRRPSMTASKAMMLASKGEREREEANQNPSLSLDESQDADLRNASRRRGFTPFTPDWCFSRGS